MPSCFIALGGNLGDVAAAFDSALKRLDAAPGVSVRQISSTYQTAPVGSSAGSGYLNAAAELHCRLPALDLLSLLQAEEQRAGRERPFHWSPRTLDLDLILYGSRLIRHSRLVVPHPAAWYRRFVLDPLAEIAGGVLHPEKRQTISALRGRLLVRPLTVRLTGGAATRRMPLAAELRRQFPQVEFTVDEQDGSGFRRPQDTTSGAPGLVLWLGPDLEATVPRNRETGLSASDRTAFELLPLASRLDLTSWPGTPAAGAVAVLQAALG